MRRRYKLLFKREKQAILKEKNSIIKDAWSRTRVLRVTRDSHDHYTNNRLTVALLWLTGVQFNHVIYSQYLWSSHQISERRKTRGIYGGMHGGKIKKWAKSEERGTHGERRDRA